MGGTAAGVDGTKIGGTLFFGSVSGGFGAVLTNGNFWQGAATGLIVSGLNHVAHEMDGVHIAQESPNTGGDPNPNRNWRQDKLLSKGEINRLEKAIGWNHGDKGQNNRGGGKKDLYKDKDGNIYEKPKGGKGPGECTGINIKDLYTGSLLNKIGEGILKIIDKASTRLTPFFMPTIVPIFMNNANEYINQVN
jgi:hypothetical protein